MVQRVPPHQTSPLRGTFQTRQGSVTTSVSITLGFSVFRKIVARCSYFVLDLFHGTSIITAVPYQYGARSDGLRSVERDAEVRNDVGHGCFEDRSLVLLSGRGDPGVTGGRLECMSGRQHARTGS